jgi:hypothetical protein
VQRRRESHTQLQKSSKGNRQFRLIAKCFKTFYKAIFVKKMWTLDKEMPFSGVWGGAPKTKLQKN